MNALWAAFAVAAAGGAVARYRIDDAVRRRQGAESPWGIVGVNVLGCLALGVVVGLGRHHGLDPDVITVVGSGGLGAFTTYSTFAVEVVRLAQTGRTARAAAVVAVTVVGGLVAAVLGLAVGGA